MPYPEHGNHTIEVRGNTIILTLFGEFNRQGALSYIQNMKDTIVQFAGQPIVILVDNTQLTGATPKAYEESNNYNQWLATQNVLAVATVYSSEVFNIIDKTRVTNKKHLNYKAFSTSEEAQQWLISFK